MKKSAYIWILVLAVFIGLIIFIYLRDKNIKAPTFLPRMDPIRGGLGSNGDPKVNCQKELRRGSRGEEVRLLQEWINRNIKEAKNRIKEDGIFGPITESNLRQISIEVLGLVVTSTSLAEIPELRQYCV